jgi:hypothetical protein
MSGGAQADHTFEGPWLGPHRFDAGSRPFDVVAIIFCVESRRGQDVRAGHLPFRGSSEDQSRCACWYEIVRGLRFRHVLHRYRPSVGRMGDVEGDARSGGHVELCRESDRAEPSFRIAIDEPEMGTFALGAWIWVFLDLTAPVAAREGRSSEQLIDRVLGI